VQVQSYYAGDTSYRGGRRTAAGGLAVLFLAGTSTYEVPSALFLLYPHNGVFGCMARIPYFVPDFLLTARYGVQLRSIAKVRSAATEYGVERSAACFAPSKCQQSVRLRDLSSHLRL
jgi:hypothetical protein